MVDRPFTDRELEALEMLAGLRDPKSQAQAVRIADVAPLLHLLPLKSLPVSTTPTADEFNALRADVAHMNKRIAALNALLQARIT